MNGNFHSLNTLERYLVNIKIYNITSILIIQIANCWTNLTLLYCPHQSVTKQSSALTQKMCLFLDSLESRVSSKGLKCWNSERYQPGLAMWGRRGGSQRKSSAMWCDVFMGLHVARSHRVEGQDFQEACSLSRKDSPEGRRTESSM